ncbi:MAG: methylenetetrahydrofolate reductase [Burkholderiales bacterium]
MQAQDSMPERLPGGEMAVERESIVGLARGCSIEITSHDPSEIDACADCIEPGAEIYISMPPGQTYHQAIAVAARIRRAGLNPVPHVAARSLASLATLDDYLARAAGEAGVKQALAIGGDKDRPAGPFDSSLKMLETGVFQKHGIRRIGVAGYPEGNPSIADAELQRALLAKQDLGRRTGLDLYLVTQFCFDAPPIQNWLQSLRTMGVDLPVRVGLAGPASITTLLKFAVRCGIGESVRALKSRRESIVRLLTEAGPDTVLRQLAQFVADRGQGQLAGIHLFSFGGFARTARWIRSVQDGRFEIVPGKAGFRAGSS